MRLGQPLYIAKTWFVEEHANGVLRFRRSFAQTGAAQDGDPRAEGSGFKVSTPVRGAHSGGLSVRSALKRRRRRDRASSQQQTGAGAAAPWRSSSNKTTFLARDMPQND